MAVSVEEFRVPQRTTSLKQIKKILSSPSTHYDGLVELELFINSCSDDVFNENCVDWMHKCIKFETVSMKQRNAACNVLMLLMKISSQFQELHRPVSTFISTRFFDYFYKYLAEYDIGWSCLEKCLIFFNAPCGVQKDAIDVRIKACVNSKNELKPVMARCYALLPCLGGGGVKGMNYKASWKEQFSKTIQTCHAILEELFKEVQELENYTVEEALDVDVNKTPEELATLLSNYCSILSSMLCEQYPVAKCVPMDAVLAAVCRGLAVTPSVLGREETSATVALRAVLPRVHSALLSTLAALIATCSRNLLPYARLVCKLVQRSLEWTRGDSGVFGERRPLGDLRIAAYAALGNWLVVAQAGSCAETISKQLIGAFVADIRYDKPSVVLQGPKGKKAVERASESQRRKVDPSANGKLCYVALKTLELFVKAVGSRLKPEEHKLLQSTVVGLLLDVHKSTDVLPYSVAKCREALYGVLLALTLEPGSKWPPPTQFAVFLLARGQLDPQPSVSRLCSAALAMIEKIIHPEFTVAAFAPSEPEGVRAVELVWTEETPRRRADEVVVDITFPDLPARQALEAVSAPPPPMEVEAPIPEETPPEEASSQPLVKESEVPTEEDLTQESVSSQSTSKSDGPKETLKRKREDRVVPSPVKKYFLRSTQSQSPDTTAGGAKQKLPPIEEEKKGNEDEKRKAEEDILNSFNESINPND